MAILGGEEWSEVVEAASKDEAKIKAYETIPPDPDGWVPLHIQVVSIVPMGPATIKMPRPKKK
jgi:hypothetical protein